MKLRMMKTGIFLVATAALISIASAETNPKLLEPKLSEERGRRTVREMIQAADMRSDGGFAYIAPLRLDRKGDRDSETSRCTLLEDGKPLPHPHSRHAAIREQGGGRYSHWTASRLHFSASDSSDPRTNGRKYELVSNESFIRRTAQVTAAGERSSFTVTAPNDARIRPLRIVLRNLDRQRAIVPRLVRSGDPDLTSKATIVASITNDDMTDQQRAIAIWKFLVDWRYHGYPAEKRGEVHDPVKLVSVYGYGFCDDSAAAFCELATEAGMKTRSYGLSGHVVAEAFYENAWHMFDPDHEVVYRTDDGRIASVAELEEHPELITRKARDPLGFPSARMAKAYTTREDNRPFQAASSAASTLRPVLGPGDRIVFDFTDRRRVHRRTHLDRPLPRSFANGELIQMLPDDTEGRHNVQVIHTRWPYVVLGGKLVFASTDSQHAISIAASIDGRKFDPLVQKTADGRKRKKRKKRKGQASFLCLSFGFFSNLDELPPD